MKYFKKKLTPPPILIFKKKPNPPQPIYLLGFETSYKVKGDKELHFNYFNVFTKVTTPPQRLKRILKREFKKLYKICGCKLVDIKLIRTLNHPTHNIVDGTEYF